MTNLKELWRRLVARRSVPAETSAIQVFVSYAHEDEQAVAGLVADLRQEGVDVWFAPRKLQPGDQISREVRAAIEKARFFLVALTQQARNSAWVAKETEYALDLEKRTNQLHVLPLYVTIRDAPDVLKDHLAIDVRPHTYRAGIRELADAIRGNLVPGRTPLARFERFVSSLPIVDDEVEKAFSMDRVAWRVGERKMTEDWARRCEDTKSLLKRKGVTERDCERILGALGGVPPALTAKEIEDIRAWLRVGQPATLAIASQLYANRFVTSPSYRRILKRNIVHQMQAWVHRGELPERDTPRPDWIIDRLVEEELIEPFRRTEYINEPDEDCQEFHEGRRLLSVGKAGYLFEISDPDRPHADYPIGRFPGSTPRAGLL